MPIEIKEFTTAAPEVYQGLTAIAGAAGTSGLDKGLIELVKLRASQINGCTYCLQFHLNLARKLGVAQAKLDQLAAWRGSPLFDVREKAALAWTEKLTLQAQALPDEADRAALASHFPESHVLYLTVTVALINAWNRINAGLDVLPPQAA